MTKKNKKKRKKPGQASTAFDTRRSSIDLPRGIRLKWIPESEQSKVRENVSALLKLAESLKESDNDYPISEAASSILDFARCEAIPHIPVILDEVFFHQQLLTASRSPTGGMSIPERIYWSEIDQRIVCYRRCVRTLLASRIRAAIALAADVPTFACILRQILEITIDSAANQWLLTASHNHLLREFATRNSELSVSPIVICSTLEEFAIALITWDKDSVEFLAGLLGRPSLINGRVPDAKPSRPTTDQQFALAEWVAGHFDNEPTIPGSNYREAVLSLKKDYAFLCGFVHPSPKLFPMSQANPAIVRQFKDQEVVSAVAKLSIRLIARCIHLANNLCFANPLDAIRFEDIVEKRARPDGLARGQSMIDLKQPYIEDFMKRSSSLVFGEGENMVKLWQRPGGDLSNRAQKIAKIFHKLSPEKQEKAAAYIRELRDGPP